MAKTDIYVGQDYVKKAKMIAVDMTAKTKEPVNVPQAVKKLIDDELERITK